MFTQRTSKPKAGNKCYITRGSGGWSSCIKGHPTDKNCNVLSNCVGYACGRFNEIYNEITGFQGMKYNTLNCNAEGFIERAKKAGLEVGSTPKAGAIICWQKGETGNSADGAGHVAVVEKVIDDNTIYTSESSYGGTAFFNATRKNTNGRWGLTSGYKCRGFIYNPAVKEEIKPEPAPEPTPTPSPATKFNIGDKVIINGPLYVTSNATEAAGNVKDKITTITRKAEGAAHPYNTEGDLGWMDESSITKYVEPTPTPTPEPKPASLKVGDKVKIIGTGNGSSRGTSNTAYGIGWTRQVLRIWDGRAYPYQVGNTSGTTGFYKADALQKK